MSYMEKQKKSLNELKTKMNSSLKIINDFFK